MGIAKKLTKNTGFVFFAEIIRKLLSFFFIAYAARVLGPSGFGLYALIGMFAFFFSYFANFGVVPMAVREIARDKNKAEELFNHIISLRFTLSILSFPILIIVTYLLDYGEEVKYLILITGLSSICSVFSGSFRILYIAFERFKIPSLISILVTFLSVIANILALYLGYGLKGIVLVSFFGNFIGTTISSIWVRKKIIKYKLTINIEAWKVLLNQSLPFVILSFFQQVGSYLNILFLSKLHGPLPGEMSIGYYNPALSLCRTAMMFPDSFKQAALPTIASNSGDNKMAKKLINKSTNILLITIILPLIIITTFFPDKIISFVFGKEYLPSVPALTILGWAYALRVFNAPVTAILSASKEINRFIPWAMLTFGVNLVLAVPLIIYYGFIGASIAFLVSMVVDTIVRNYLLQAIYCIKIWALQENLNVVIPIVVTFIIILFAYLNSVSPVMLLIISVILYVICVVNFKDFRQGVVSITNGIKEKKLSMEGMSGKK